MASNAVATSSLPLGDFAPGNGHATPRPAAKKRQSMDGVTVKVAGSAGPQILTFALQQRPRATRASVPKVRTGCLTCKKRHVKCDEAKPSCQRCIKWQGFCEGYESRNSPPRTSSNASLKPTAVKPVDLPPASSVLGSGIIQTGVITVLPNPSGSHVFTSGWEKVYFDDWLALTETVGGEWFTSTLFSKTIPQLAREDPALRHAAMAIGAMANATSPTFLPGSCPGPATMGPHYKNALSYYGQALRLIRLNQGPTDAQLRSALIACLLFVCFETLHGHREAALHHINHGMMIVEQSLRMRKEKQKALDALQAEQGSAPNSAASSDDNRPLLEMDSDTRAPYALDDEIIQVFQRLDFQSWSTSLTCPRRIPPRLDIRTTGMPNIESIPTSFHSFNEARRWWDLVQHWVLHFPRTIVDEMAQLNISQQQPAMADFCDLPGVTERRTEYLACLERWNAAFWPLYVSARANSRASPDNYYRAASLRLQYQIAWISTRAICFSDYETMYSMTPHFRELNRLGAVLLPAQQSHPPGRGGGKGLEIFTLDNGPTMALFIVATKCREIEVREEAIALMRRYPRRDGFWDSRCAVLIAELNRGIEEENQQDGTLAEQWWRLRQREAVFDPSGKSAKIRFFKKDAVRGWHMTEVVMSLSK